MRFSKSIRWRLLLWYGLLLAALLGGFGYTAWRLEVSSHYQQVDHELQRRISAITNALRAFRSPGPIRPPRVDLKLPPADAALFDASDSRGYYYAVWLREAEPAARSAKGPAQLVRPESGDASPRQRENLREAFLFAAPVDCVLVGCSTEDDFASQRRLAWLLVTVGGVVLALGLAGGWWLISRALRPVQDISHAAARIAGGDLSQRINTANTESELGELATVLNSTFTRLDDAFAQQARFTSDAAHELRTPVAVLLAQTQAALNRERGAADYRNALLANQTTGQRMRRLIESLLELSRFDAGHEPLGRQACDLVQIAEDGIEVLQPVAEAKHIVIRRELSEAMCHVDPGHIGQVVINLLTNAIEYNREGGEVKISTFREGDRAVLVVADNGPGIRREDLPYIFERFYRADTARASAASRTGLGLAISKAIVEAHGGTLVAASEYGHGAVFTLSLPAVEQAATQGGSADLTD